MTMRGCSQLASILAMGYLRLLSERHISPRVGHLVPLEDSRESGQNGLAIPSDLIADVRATEAASSRPGEEAP